MKATQPHRWGEVSSALLSLRTPQLSIAMPYPANALPVAPCAAAMLLVATVLGGLRVL